VKQDMSLKLTPAVVWATAQAASLRVHSAYCKQHSRVCLVCFDLWQGSKNPLFECTQQVLNTSRKATVGPHVRL
jgi:hypothetical protein